MVDIRVQSRHRDTPEYKAALLLQRRFAATMYDGVEGQIVIAPNVTCFGEEYKDIDIVVVGHVACVRDRAVGLDASATATPQLNTFCVCVEAKNHPRADVDFWPDSIRVKYDMRRHNATKQIEGERRSLYNLLHRETGMAFDVCGLLWFTSISAADLPDRAVGCMPRASDVNYRGFEALVAAQLPRVACQAKASASTIAISPADRIAAVEKALAHFDSLQESIGKLTQERLRRVRRKPEFAWSREEAGERLIVISGRPGTGKTVRAMGIAHDLCSAGDMRCLVLTYNRALASDLKRTVALCGVRRGSGGGTVKVQTIDSYIGKLAWQLDTNRKLGPNDFSGHEQRVKRVLRHLRSSADAWEKLIDEAPEDLDWDLVIVDEGQDWPREERDVLFELYGSGSVIVTDGGEQLVRSPKRLDWTQGVDDFRPVKLRRMVRQRPGPARFVKEFAGASEARWDDLQIDETGHGGRVIISTAKRLDSVHRAYSAELHTELLGMCRSEGNGPYEMLMLVPPKLVPHNHRGTKLAGDFERWGVKIWDGTIDDKRSEYPTSLQEHRVVQYDSCRGLEGSVVVCLLLDEFARHKSDRYPAFARIQGTLALDEERVKYAHEWVLTALTRAVDVLAITLWDPNSSMGRLLREVSQRCPDVVEWRD